VIGLPGLAELQELIGRLGDAQARVLAHGDPARLAGDPAAIGRLADAHRRAAGALREVQGNSRAGVAQVSGAGLWEGSASDAFMGYWDDTHTRVGELASSHDQLAIILDGVASEAARFNSDVQTALGSVGSWLESAAGAVVRMDPGEIERLLGRGRVLPHELQRLLDDIQQFTGRVVRQVTTDLAFAVRRASIPGPEPGRGPQINVPWPGKRDGPLINVPWPGTPHGPQITVPISGKPKPLINVPWPGTPHGPLITVPWPKPKRDVDAASEKEQGGSAAPLPTPKDLRGKTPGQIRTLLRGWKENPARKGEGQGIRFSNPNSRSEVVTIIYGKPHPLEDPVKQGPYARISDPRSGRSDPIPLAGNPTL
jgi:hypothetical protein